MESSIPFAMSHESQELENYHITRTMASKQITYVRGKNLSICAAHKRIDQADKRQIIFFSYHSNLPANSCCFACRSNIAREQFSFEIMKLSWDITPIPRDLITS